MASAPCVVPDDPVEVYKGFDCAAQISFQISPSEANKKVFQLCGKYASFGLKTGSGLADLKTVVCDGKQPRVFVALNDGIDFNLKDVTVFIMTYKSANEVFVI